MLVIDSDPRVRSGICSYLRRTGYVAAEAATTHEARLQLPCFQPAAIVAGISPDGNATGLLEELKRAELAVPILFLRPEDYASGAVVCPPHEGSTYFPRKLVDRPALERQLATALDAERRRHHPNSVLCKSRRDILDPFLGTSSAIRKLEQMASRLLASESPILIQGETGSGKGVLANWIHQKGTRSGEEFHDLNCAGLSRELLETELFGHRKGSFTGALEDKLGLFEAANHGTLFLDEIGDVDPLVQSKLLKVLEEQKFRRLGEVRERSADVRLIAATRSNLEHLVAQGKFRDDLYYRINVVRIVIPPLRERYEDIPVLTHFLIDCIAHKYGRKPMEIDDSAMDALQRHSWPGNIRELRNVLERAVQFSDTGTVTRSDLQIEGRQPPGHQGFLDGTDCTMTLKQLQDAYIERVLREERGSVERAARRLGIARSSLYNKIKPSAVELAPIATG